MPGSYPTQAAPQGQTMQDSNAALLANLSRGRGIGRGMAIRQPGKTIEIVSISKSDCTNLKFK